MVQLHPPLAACHLSASSRRAFLSVACRSMTADAAAGAAAPASRKVVSIVICRVSSQVQFLTNQVQVGSPVLSASQCQGLTPPQ